MIRIWLAYMLTALIALQSVVAMADFHQSHQSGIEHVEFDHEHGLKPNEDNKPPLEQFDCHHCCHCHGVAYIFLINTTPVIDTPSLAQGLMDYSVHYLSCSTSLDLRPPIV